ncbi:collagenase [Chitinimonas sp. PSY-7]|uniref:collagenase n=1 Tax=Chitinimonas sp. PSY-7 TaxID=3459088 RepID=UPI00403FDB6C
MTRTAKPRRLTPLFLIVGAIFLPVVADVGPPKKNNAPTSSVRKTQDYESYERNLQNVQQQRSMQKKDVAAEAKNSGCRIGDMAAMSGDSLIKEIQSLNCFEMLFYTNGYERSLFEESKMKTVADELVRLTYSYETSYKTNELSAILAYLQAGYTYRYYNDDKFEYSYALKQRVKQGLEYLLNSGTSRIVDYNNQDNIGRAYRIIFYSRDFANYLPVLKTKLLETRSDFFRDNKSLDTMKVMFLIWTAATRVDPNDPYLKDMPAYKIDANKIVRNDYSYFSAFKTFYDNNISLLGTNNDDVLMSAASNLVNGMYQEQFKSRIKSEVKGILKGIDLYGKGNGVYVTLAGALDEIDIDAKTRKSNCAEYNTCNLKDAWVARYMPSRKSCSPYIRLIAQPDIPSGRLDEACQLVLAEEKLFINALFGVSPDKAYMVAGPKDKPKFDSGIEMTFFKSKEDYAKFGRAVFKIDTNNGGYQLEGDTSNIGNIQHFWAYHKDGVDGTNELEGQYIWNLKHEFVHYLDNVFNHGNYGGFYEKENRLVWWMEGVAEYISHQNVYPQAIEAARKKTYTLSNIFNHTYDMSDYFGRAYTWGYLGVRFMFERHRNDVEKMLVTLRNGQPEAYQKLLFSDIGTRYDNEFTQWLSTVSDGGEFAGAKYAGGINVATPNRGVGKITFDAAREYKHSDSVLIYGNPYTYSLLENGQVNSKDSTTGWRCIPLTCNKTFPYQWSSQLGYWTPGGTGTTGGGTTGGGTTGGGTTGGGTTGGGTTGGGTTGGGTTGGGTTGGGTTGGGAGGTYDGGAKYKNGDVVEVGGKRYTLTVLVNNQPGGTYLIWGSYCDPAVCSEDRPYKFGGWLHAYWATVGSGGGTTGGGGTRATGTFDEYRQYRNGDKAVFNGQSYTLTITVDRNPVDNYPIYGATCVPTRCTYSQPWVNTDGRSSAYWQ